jgi:hypothetical protein
VKTHRIRVKVEIIECEEESTGQDQPQRVGDGEFELMIDEEVAGSIDDCEQALLATNYPAIREALSKHLAEWSKKRPAAEAEEKSKPTR